METHVYKVADTEIALDLYRTGSSGAHPTIVFIHGGGLILGSRKALIAPLHVQPFLDAGFNFVSIDYRLAPETRLPEIASDVADAWSWLRAHAAELGIDRDRMGLFGHSAGAFLALLGGCRLHPRPFAIGSIAGYGRLLTDAFAHPSDEYLKLSAANEAAAFAAVGGKAISASGPSDSIQWFTGRGHYYLYCRQKGVWLEAVTGHDVRDRQWFARFEPLHNFDSEFPPTLLLHGESDADVPFAEAVAVRDALAEQGIPIELVSDPNWGHAFLYMAHDPTVAPAMSRLVEFFELNSRR